MAEAPSVRKEEFAVGRARERARAGERERESDKGNEKRVIKGW